MLCKNKHLHNNYYQFNVKNCHLTRDCKSSNSFVYVTNENQLRQRTKLLFIAVVGSPIGYGHVQDNVVRFDIPENFFK